MSDSNPPRLLSFTLDDWPVLGGPVTISLNDGVAVLVGRNGAGKSAILEGFMGISLFALGNFNQSLDNDFSKNNFSKKNNDVPKKLIVNVLTPTGCKLEYSYELICKLNDFDLDDFAKNSSKIKEFSWHDKCQYLDNKQETIWETHDGVLSFSDSSKQLFDPENEIFANILRNLTGSLDFLSSSSQMLDEVRWIHSVLTGVRFLSNYSIFRSRTSWSRHSIILKIPYQGNHWRELSEVLSHKIHLRIEKNEIEELKNICQRIGIVNTITEKKFFHMGEEDYHSEILLDNVNLGLLSDGTLRILSILVDLINSTPTSTFIIEEPESQIHPGMLEKLLNEIESYTYGQNLILSTHSPQVVSWTQPNKINLVHRENGRTFVRKLGENEIYNVADYLNEEGDLGDWIYSGILDE